MTLPSLQLRAPVYMLKLQQSHSLIKPRLQWKSFHAEEKIPTRAVVCVDEMQPYDPSPNHRPIHEGGLNVHLHNVLDYPWNVSSFVLSGACENDRPKDTKNPKICSLTNRTCKAWKKRVNNVLFVVVRWFRSKKKMALQRSKTASAEKPTAHPVHNFLL